MYMKNIVTNWQQQHEVQTSVGPYGVSLMLKSELLMLELSKAETLLGSRCVAWNSMPVQRIVDKGA